jgi:hypothetical protein
MLIFVFDEQHPRMYANTKIGTYELAPYLQDTDETLLTFNPKKGPSQALAHSQYIKALIERAEFHYQHEFVRSTEDAAQ